MKKFILCTSLLLCYGIVSVADEYPKTEIKKFKSGGVQQKAKYTAYQSIEQSETFFENGKKKISYSRTETSKDPFKPDTYKFSQWDDQGRVLAEGQCKVSTTSDFFGDSSCYVLTGTESRYDKEGHLYSQSQYKDGQLDGESMVITEKAIIKNYYKAGTKYKTQELNPQTKAVTKTEEFFEDGSKK